jgi:hypothetical protein
MSDESNELAAWRASVTHKLDTVILNTSDHEARMRALEKEQWLHRGGLAVVAIMFAGFLKKIGLYG